MAASVKEVSSHAELGTLCDAKHLTAVVIWAPWHPPSAHLTKVLDVLAKEHKTLRFAKVNADVCASLVTHVGADQVPFVAFLDGNMKKVDELPGADPPKLVAKVKELATRATPTGPPSACGSNPGACVSGTCSGAGGGASTNNISVEDNDLNSRLRKLINFSPVIAFIKGTKDEPQCKFSRQLVEIMKGYEVEYSTFDILLDDEVRQGLKEYSNWKTYPQLYVHGELIGGIDVVKDMHEDGGLSGIFPDDCKSEQKLEDRLKSLIRKAPVMLFMKGHPDAPKCGFSSKIVATLRENEVNFDSFDILSDEDVRQGLKDYSNWKTYPQLYANGCLIGGLDIVKDLAEEGELLDALASST